MTHVGQVATTLKKWVSERGMTAVVVGFCVAAVACDDPLEVEDPNSLAASDLEDPAAMPALANGALSTTARAMGELASLSGTASDELRWIGSFDAWNDIHQGNVDKPTNQFSDQYWPDVTNARFMVDKAIEAGERFQSENTLRDPRDLARSYLYGAVLFTSIGDLYDDFVVSEDADDPSPPVGESNMDQFYDRALEWETAGIDMARNIGDQELEARLLAMRARTRHAKQVWAKLNPSGSTPADPLVASSEMADDARAVLQIVGSTSNWKYQLQYSPNTITNITANNINQRGELQFGPTIVSVDPDQTTVIEEVLLEDPIDEVTDPVMSRFVNTFTASGDEFVPFTVVSAREMHLLLAENALATGNGSFADHVNDVRAMDGLTPYSGQIPAVDLLAHERRVNLFLQNRRLIDMYRFGIRSGAWLEVSAAFRTPGSFFPIAVTEIRSNPNVGG